MSKVMRPLLALQAGLILGSSFACTAQDKAAKDTAVRQLVEAFAKAENSRDSDKLSQFFTDDGDVIVQGQTLAHGRDAIKKCITPRIPWSEIGPATYKIQNIRFLNGETAVVDADRTAYSSTFVRASSATFVLAKTGGAWKLASYRNFRTGPPLPADSPFSQPGH